MLLIRELLSTSEMEVLRKKITPELFEELLYKDIYCWTALELYEIAFEVLGNAKIQYLLAEAVLQKFEARNEEKIKQL